MTKRYPRALVREARTLVRKGVPKCDTAKILGLERSTVYYLTRDMAARRGHPGIRGKSLELVRLLVQRGYVTSGEVKHLVSCMRTIGKYLPVRRVRVGRARVATVWLLPGRERDAMEAYLRLAGRRSIGYEELGMIRRTFGVKNIKRNDKIKG
jgi:hypothetical protein